MISPNPFREFKVQCDRILRKQLISKYHDFQFPEILLEIPPNIEFGELATSVCYELAKQTQKTPIEVAEQIVEATSLSDSPLIAGIDVAGRGYINFHVDFNQFNPLTIISIRTADVDYGHVTTNRPKTIIIEHTSVNPIHPIHIGQARNPVIGDATARLLFARGHSVSRHYYVDDVGRQSAVIAYGYHKLNRPKPTEKPDKFIGAIYALTSCIIELTRLKQIIDSSREASHLNELPKLQKELKDWNEVATDLRNRFPKLFDRLYRMINQDSDPESQVNNLIREYEAGNADTKRLIRDVCHLCLSGFKETLQKAGISHDSWDWESDFIWNGNVNQVLEKLKATPYVFWEGPVLEFNAEKVAQDFQLKKNLGLADDYEIPSLTLVRADGTTLYTTRDIAYHLWKFCKAERVINVIGMEQKLSQIQLKLALSALGYANETKNLVHFAYNLVSLPGQKMSSRRGRYISLDEVMEESIKRAYREVSKRSPHLSEDQKLHISTFVGMGAVKYALVQVDPMKPVIFTWDRVLDFEKNSAPYIQYAHARANSILRKAAKNPENPDYTLLNKPNERKLILLLSRFPEVFIDAAESLKPDTIADYVNRLADTFNQFYTVIPVIKAKPLELSDARLALVDSARIVFRNALTLLGIEAPERM